MHDFRVGGLEMTGFMLIVVLLNIDDGLGMTGFELAAHVLYVRMRDNFGCVTFS